MSKPPSAAEAALSMAMREAFGRNTSDVSALVQNVMGNYPRDASFVLATNVGRLEHQARQFAYDAHRDQKRKYTNAPYITHPYCVRNIVACVPHDEAMLAAAWLHDVVEDCGVDICEITERFGFDVAGMVAKLSDISTKADGNREMRKKIDREWTATADARTQTIKLADLCDNSHSIMQYDPQFAVNYLAEKRLLLGVLDKGDRNLWAIADRICTEAGF